MARPSTFRLRGLFPASLPLGTSRQEALHGTTRSALNAPISGLQKVSCFELLLRPPVPSSKLKAHKGVRFRDV